MKQSDHQTIQRVLDGSISQAAFAGFQQHMRMEPELAKLYGEYALLHHSLCEEFEDQPIRRIRSVVPRRDFPAKIAWFAIAAAVALFAGFYYQNSRKSAPATASVRFSADAVWIVQGASSSEGNLSKGATLQLLRGQASVVPSPGASALIEGPSTLTYVSPEMLHLAEGRGRFRLDQPGGKLEVTTASMSAVDLGTEFGIETHPDRPDELHVFQGKVRMQVGGDNRTLSAGEAGRVAGADRIEGFVADESRFFKTLVEFENIFQGPFVAADWRVESGSPSISEDRIEGMDFTAFRRLTQSEPDRNRHVLLATLEVDVASNEDFHTDGWAGVSFFSKGAEVLFFGDSFGPERTWSLDVKQRKPVILPNNPVIGMKSVTLRYDRSTGEVSMHEGGIPLAPAFCSGNLPAGMTFDEIRLGASSNASLAVKSLVVQAGG